MEAFELLQSIVMEKHSNQINTLWWNVKPGSQASIGSCNGSYVKISFHTFSVKSGNYGHQVNSDSDLAYFIF